MKLVIIFLCCIYVYETKMYILNDKTEGFTNQISASEVAASVAFFVENIGNQFVFEDGFAFERLENSSFFQRNLKFIKKSIKQIDVSDLQTSDNRKVFFLNLSNMLTLDFILSLKKLPENLDKFPNYEDKVAYIIGGKTLTLAAMKHGILRGNEPNPSSGEVYLEEEDKMWVVPKDPRNIFGLYPTGTKSFPAFNTENLNPLLTQLTLQACKDGVKINEADSSLQIDEIFNTFSEDFSSSDTGLYRWLSDCVENQAIAQSLYFVSLDLKLTKVHFKPSISLISQSIGKKAEEKLQVDIYIQSLCEDVHDFFIHQLEPTWKRSSSIMDINLIAYGKASVRPINNGEKFEFECQHGFQECQGNQLISCIVAYLPVDSQISLLTCMMADVTSGFSEIECSKKLSIPMSAIKECTMSVEGSELLYESGEKTLQLKPKLFFVPTITIKGVYNSTSLQRSVKHFSDFICDSYMSQQSYSSMVTPQGCKVQMGVFIDPLDSEVHKFFLEQLIPTWNRIKGSINLKIIPFVNKTEQREVQKDGNGSTTKANTEVGNKCSEDNLRCQMNFIVSCIVKLLPIKLQIPIFNCLFKGKSTYKKGRMCTEEEGIEWKAIESCAEGPIGTYLMKQNRLEVNLLDVPELFNLPMITINKLSNSSLSTWAKHDLTSLVCDAYLPTKRPNTALTERVSLPKGCPVRVEFFMEMLCPDTRNFIRNQLYPSWKILQPMIDLHIIPFGKADVWLDKEGSSYEFECQHGPKECQGNKVMSCIVEYLPIDIQVEFLYCMISDRSPSEAGKQVSLKYAFEKCALSLGVTWEPLELCSNSEEGSKLLFQNGILTTNLRPSLFYVPTLTLNNYYDATQLRPTLHDFQNQICEVYQGEESQLTASLTPKGCKLKVKVYLSVSTSSSKQFFKDQLLPTWNKLGKSSLDIEFVPVEDLKKLEIRKCLSNAKCSLNLMFACVSYYYDVDYQMNFLDCIMEANATLEIGKKCSKKLHLSWDKISKCYRSENGLRIMIKNLERIKLLRPTFHQIPTVTLNGFHDKTTLKESVTDFMGLVCKSFQDLSISSSTTWRPKGCPVTVKFYLGSRCRDAKINFVTQIAPTWTKLKSILNLEIIPFGKAIAKIVDLEKDQYEFTCQNGRMECDGNILMSCIVQHYPIEHQVNIFQCMLRTNVLASRGSQCAEVLGYKWSPIQDCIRKEGPKLLYENSLKTAIVKPKIFYIPTITINEFYNKNTLRQSLKDLSSVVCETYMKDFEQTDIDDVPDGCRVKINVYFNRLDFRMTLFFSSEAEEIWRIYRRVIQLKLTPLINDWALATETTGLNVSHICSGTEDGCYESKLLSCITQTYKIEVQMEYLTCLMSSIELDTRMKDCSSEIGLNLDALDFCASSKGFQLLQSNQDDFQTHHKSKNKIKLLPLVTVNEFAIHEHRHLQRMICSRFRGPKPSECNIYRHPLN